MVISNQHQIDCDKRGIESYIIATESVRSSTHLGFSQSFHERNTILIENSILYRQRRIGLPQIGLSELGHVKRG